VGAPISSFILQAFNGVAGLPGWRWLFLVEGAPAVLLGFVAYRLLIDRPAQARWLSTDERDWLTGTLDAEAKLSTHKDGLRAALVTMLDWRTLLVTFTGVCFVIGFYGTGFWLPQIIKTFHVPTLEIGLLTALPNLLGAIAMLGWGQLSRGRSTPLRYVVLPLLLAGAALLMAAHLLQTPVLAMVAFCVAMIGLYACMPAYWALPSFFFGGASTAVALAFINAVSNLGGFFGPALMGWLTGTTHSFALATAMLGGFVIVGALALLGLAPAFAHRPVPVALHSS
jgi:ACS family tartrate transporter-like MFS transporter